jgi:acetolactate synthase-1/2/3 large subunit
VTAATTGSDEICEALLRAGIECAFGLPGTQNVALYEALRTSRLRAVVATHELSAAMMANGYYRASGRAAALVTIPGPGFTWALTGIAEASLDSAALLHLVGAPATEPGARHQLQAIDQAAIARPLVRAVHRIERADEIDEVIAAARDDALGGEPGPVLVHVARSVLGERAGIVTLPAARPAPRTAPKAAEVEAVAKALRGARRSVILAGQGSAGAAAALLRLAETLSAAVITTTSGRGAIAEDHPLSLGLELDSGSTDALNALVGAADLVLAIGCKFSHNGSRGFALRIAPEKLIHVDASADVPGANYPAGIAIHADAGAFLDALVVATGAIAQPGFDAAELARLRERAKAPGSAVEPRVHGVASGTAAEFFAILRRVLPRESILVTDSGLHQALARRHFRVLAPRGLITPTNLQSMGFGIGAAIGACIAAPDRPVVAVVGDGGLAMSGLELLTAVRERLRLVVIAFVDGAYGLIRMQQLSTSGHAFATEFEPPDVAALAATIGANYLRLEGDAERVLGEALAFDGVTLLEVDVGDSPAVRWMRAKTLAKRAAGPRARRWLQRLRGRR